VIPLLLYTLLYWHCSVSSAVVIDHLLPPRRNPLSGQIGDLADPTIHGLALDPQQTHGVGRGGHHAALQQVLKGKRKRGLSLTAAVGACRKCNLRVLMCCHCKIGHDPFAPRFLSPP
jgi:hypothetical protein